MEKGNVVDAVLCARPPFVPDTESEGWAIEMMDGRDKFFIACVTTAVVVFTIIYILMRVVTAIAQVDR